MTLNKNELPKNSEQWASIDGFKNYQVSWWGRVRNAKTGRILKANLSSNTYLTLSLSKKGQRKSFSVHALVAHEWVENPGNKRCVDHIDGNKTNNHYENLRYATSSENGMNAKNRTDGSSVYKGVSYQTKAGKWKSTIVLEGRSMHLGLFEQEREAAEVYNAAALEHFGIFARINILESDL